MNTLPGLLRRAIVDPLFSLLVPASCGICEQPMENWTRVPVCRACWAAVRPYEGAECVRCGYFLGPAAASHGAAICALCRHGAFSFDACRSYGWHDGALRDLIQRFKFSRFAPLARPLSALLSEALERMEAESYDAVLAVPLHPRRERQRGFNQAALLAAELARRRGIRSVGKDCVRVRNTPPQTGLRAAERRKNVAGAFAVPHPQRVRGLRLLLIDDVLTTGATASACAAAVKSAGARSVSVLTLARARATWLDV